MAPLHRLVLVLVLAPFFSAVSARPGLHFHPCNTLFVTYTIAAPVDEGDGPFPVHHHRSFAVLHLRPADPDTLLRPIHPLALHHHHQQHWRHHSMPSLGVSDSLRERAKDVLVVVVGLLFGVGCGALTAATMYLAWSLFTNRYEICGSDAYGYDEDEEADEIESPKKMGYASIPPAPATPASPVKEGN